MQLACRRGPGPIAAEPAARSRRVVPPDVRVDLRAGAAGAELDVAAVSDVVQARPFDSSVAVSASGGVGRDRGRGGRLVGGRGRRNLGRRGCRGRRSLGRGGGRGRRRRWFGRLVDVAGGGGASVVLVDVAGGGGASLGAARLNWRVGRRIARIGRHRARARTSSPVGSPDGAPIRSSRSRPGRSCSCSASAARRRADRAGHEGRPGTVSPVRKSTSLRLQRRDPAVESWSGTSRMDALEVDHLGPESGQLAREHLDRASRAR